MVRLRSQSVIREIYREDTFEDVTLQIPASLLDYYRRRRENVTFDQLILAVLHSHRAECEAPRPDRRSVPTAATRDVQKFFEFLNRYIQHREHTVPRDPVTDYIEFLREKDRGVEADQVELVRAAEGAQGHFFETIRLATRLLRAAATNNTDLGPGVANLTREEAVALEVDAEEAIRDSLGMQISWDTFNHTTFSWRVNPSTVEPADFWRFLRASWVFQILTSFTVPDPDSYSNGAYFIGCCPVCGLFFDKQRTASQVYDRSTCQNTATNGRDG